METHVLNDKEQNLGNIITGVCVILLLAAIAISGCYFNNPSRKISDKDTAIYKTIVVRDLGADPSSVIVHRGSPSPQAHRFIVSFHSLDPNESGEHEVEFENEKIVRSTLKWATPQNNSQ